MRSFIHSLRDVTPQLPSGRLSICLLKHIFTHPIYVSKCLSMSTLCLIVSADRKAACLSSEARVFVFIGSNVGPQFKVLSSGVWSSLYEVSYNLKFSSKCQCMMYLSCHQRAPASEDQSFAFCSGPFMFH